MNFRLDNFIENLLHFLINALFGVRIILRFCFTVKGYYLSGRLPSIQDWNNSPNGFFFSQIDENILIISRLLMPLVLIFWVTYVFLYKRNKNRFFSKTIILTIIIMEVIFGCSDYMN